MNMRASSDEQLRESRLWKKVVQAHSKVTAAQAAGNGSASLKAWRELSALIVNNAPDEVSTPEPMSEARKELHRVFPDLSRAV